MNKRQLLGRLYGPLVRARHSRSVRVATSLAGLPSQHRRYRENVPYFAVDIAGVMGLGAVLTHGLLFCRYSELSGLTPQISSTNPLYSIQPGADCLRPYLGSMVQVAGLRPMRFRHSDSFFHLPIPGHLALEDANRLFWAWFSPKDSVRRELGYALAEVPDKTFDLSIHYRGTDKVLEVQAPSFKSFEQAILRHVAFGGSLRHVFLATDDPDFERLVRARWPATVFRTYNLGAASVAGRPRHFSDMPANWKAVEAIVNMFLLARAPTCIRSLSYMSSMSKIINLDLSTVTLNAMRKGPLPFPEYEIAIEERSFSPR